MRPGGIDTAQRNPTMMRKVKLARLGLVDASATPGGVAAKTAGVLVGGEGGESCEECAKK